jgi:hypothetical protein
VHVGGRPLHEKLFKVLICIKIKSAAKAKAESAHIDMWMWKGGPRPTRASASDGGSLYG